MRSRTLRALLAGITALAAALLLAPGAAAKAKGFKYGVTAADVTSDSAILWARANNSGTTYLQLIEKGGFGACNADHGVKVKAKKSNDNTVQMRVDGLDSDTSYRYRYCRPSGKRSDKGRFTTAPGSKQKKTISFALTGDQDARPAPGGTTPYWNNFEVWSQIMQQENDFNVLMGDTIYSDTSVPGYTVSDVALTVKQKWQAYRTNLAMRPWAKARGSAAYYAHWDDHEFINDFSTFEDSFPLGVGTVTIDGDELYERGTRAFLDYNPATYSDKTGIYRSVRWGKNLEVFFLDERSFRSAGAEYQGACDNPPGSGDPDLAPTAPQNVRNVFSAIAPPLANPVSPECLAAINDPNRTMLGSRQLKRFKKAVANSDAAFKVIMNEVPIQQFYALPYDRWEGYAAERAALLQYLQQKAKNVVFLTTDVHANLVNDARFNTLGDGGVQNSGILDITTGPVATETYSGEINATVGNESAGPLVQELFFKPQPPNGVGMQCAATDQYSFAQVRVSKKQMTVDLLDAQGQPVVDTGEIENAPPDTPRCAKIVIPRQ